MAIGLGVLKLEPKVFWSMTMKEIEVVVKAQLGKSNAIIAPTRARLRDLMKKYPDGSG